MLLSALAPQLCVCSSARYIGYYGLFLPACHAHKTPPLAQLDVSAHVCHVSMALAAQLWLCLHFIAHFCISGGGDDEGEFSSCFIKAVEFDSEKKKLGRSPQIPQAPPPPFFFCLIHYVPRSRVTHVHTHSWGATRAQAWLIRVGNPLKYKGTEPSYVPRQ